MASLTGPNLKITRAVEHLNALESELDPLVRGELYIISNYVELETRKQFWKLVNDPPVIPDAIALLIGDSLYNFRAGLDHLIWQLVLLNEGCPNCRNEFPIFSGESTYKRDKKPRLKGLSDTAIAIIDGLQPYNAENWPLGMLHSLSNVDKHRHLHLAVSSLVMHRISATNRPSGGVNPFFATSQTGQGAIGHFGPIEKGTILYSILSPDVAMKVEPVFDIVFSDGDVSRLSVRDAMRSIRDFINKIFIQLSPLFGGGYTEKV